LAGRARYFDIEPAEQLRISDGEQVGHIHPENAVKDCLSQVIGPLVVGNLPGIETRIAAPIVVFICD